MYIKSYKITGKGTNVLGKVILSCLHLSLRCMTCLHSSNNQLRHKNHNHRHTGHWGSSPHFPLSNGTMNVHPYYGTPISFWPLPHGPSSLSASGSALWCSRLRGHWAKPGSHWIITRKGGCWSWEIGVLSNTTWMLDCKNGDSTTFSWWQNNENQWRHYKYHWRSVASQPTPGRA